jgi:hypothetical protein
MTIKPLNALTKRPSNSSSANPPTSIDNYEHHSKHSEARGQHYKDSVVGKMDTAQFGDRAVERLNPNTAAPGVRSFPGLANG